MKWIKQGRIYDGSATTPIPMLLDASTIRIYFGKRDKHGVGRIFFIDVDAANPKKIKHVTKKPVLDIGKPGMFDDNGVILGDIIKEGRTWRMYYVGFQIPQRAKFLAFSGLAVSRDHGASFTRVSDTPIFDRAPGEEYIRAIHSVMKEKGIWRIWYGAGNSWEIIKGKPYPKYSIYYTESSDGITFFSNRKLCIPTTGLQYRMGRPRVYKTASGYEMYYTIGTKQGKFFPGWAVSKDGITWRRRDADVGIAPSPSGWDSLALGYPSILWWRNRTYMFYCGNNFGTSGLGYAILSES